MLKYNKRVEVDQFEVITDQEAKLVKAAAGSIARNGIRYPDNMPNTVIFRSDNALDLINAMKNKCWDHTEISSTRDLIGYDVYVIVNSTVVNDLGTEFAIKAKATSSAINVTNNTKMWTSSMFADPDVMLDKAIEADTIEGC